jgi:hypothetical protein
MAWYAINNPTANDGDNTLVVIEGGCCEAPGTLTDCVIASHNASTGPVASINIDGTDYTFTTSADTGQEVEDGINEAMVAAGYFDEGSYGTLVSGANTALYIRITSTATITNITTVADADVNFTCS